MDTIVLRNITIIPKDARDNSFPRGIRFSAQLIIEDVMFEQTEEVTKEEAVYRWELPDVFLVPVTYTSFNIGIVKVDMDGVKTHQGAVEIKTELIRSHVSERETHFVVQTSNEDDKEFLEVSFTAYSSTSILAKGPSPTSLLSVVKPMGREAIIALLTQIVISDTTFMNPDLGLLSTIHVAVIKLPREGVHKPRALGLLANIHLARYDTFTKMMGENADKYPMYVIYSRGIDKAISMLDEALDLAADDHPKRPWMMISLSMCLQRKLIQQNANPVTFRTMSFKMYNVVPHIPDDEVQKPILSNYLGEALGRCFTHGKDSADLDMAIASHEDAVRLTSKDSPYRVTFLIDLITSLLQRVELHEKTEDTDRLLVVQEEALSLAPADFMGKVPIFRSLGHSYFIRYKELGDVACINTSIRMYEEALTLLPDDHPERPSVLNNLAASLSIRRQEPGALSDLTKAISMVHQAVQLTSNTDPIKFQFVANLGNSILSRFEMDAWDVNDFKVYNRAIQEAIPFASTNNDTANILGQNFEKFTVVGFKGLSDSVIVDEIVPLFRSTIGMFPKDFPPRTSMLYNLGCSLFGAFSNEHDRLLLDQTIDLLEIAIELCPESSSKKALWTSTLGSVYLSRFIHFDEQCDMDKAETLSTSSLDTIPTDHPDRPTVLRNLSNLYFQRFNKAEDTQYLDRSIETYRDVFKGPGLDTRPERSRWLNELSLALLRRFEKLGVRKDISEAISTLESALRGLHNDPLKRAEGLFNLSKLLFLRFHRFQDMDDLDRALAYLDDYALTSSMEKPDNTTYVLQSYYDDMLEYFQIFSGIADIDICVEEMKRIASSPSKPKEDLRIHNIGMFLSIRLGRPNAIEVIGRPALESLEDSIKALPDTRVDRGLWFSMLGDVFLRMFEQFRLKDDLDKAIFLGEEAIRTPWDTGRSKSGRLFKFILNLISSLHRRFRLLGDLADLNRSLNILENAAMICPKEDPSKYRLLDALAASLMRRYDLLGDIVDFNRSAHASQEAMSTVGDDHPDRYILFQNIGLLYKRRLKMSGDRGDAELAVDMLKSTMDGLPEQHPGRLDAMATYSNALLDRFWHFRASEDVDEAIATLEAVLSQVPNNSTLKASILHDLGSALSQRFVHRGDLEDINKCISLYMDAKDIMPDDGPSRYMLLFDIGRWLPARYERLHDKKDLEDADAALFAAASMQSAPYMWRFRATSLRSYWKQALEGGIATDLEGYKAAMALLPKLAWLGMSIESRQLRLFEVGDVVLDAVAAAVECSRYDLAIEWLEQGRSMTWGQIVELRTPTDTLQSSHPELALKFAELSSSLGGIESLQDFSPQASSYSDNVESKASASQRYHELADERDKLLRHIRTLEGFHDFLFPKSISDLLRAAFKGPVITLNINKFRCDALVLLPNANEVLHVPLDEFSASEAHNLMTTLKRLLKSRNGLRSKDRAPKRSPFARRLIGNPEIAFQEILSKLWRYIAKPVLDRIGLTSLPEGSTLPRIWWCLTGSMTLLPIHAAGIYGSDNLQNSRSKLSDYAVSSYTPSISALIRCSQPREIYKKNLVAIALPIESDLPCTQAEIESIQKHNDAFPVAILLESAATLENVVRGIENAGWVHFACHGIQDKTDPTQSALMLSGNTKLTLSDISKLALPHAELAFLSACQTATGDELLPEEAVHLAAGMLSAGYQGVVGTMWSIVDSEGPKIADEFYTQLLNNGKPDPAEAAYALHTSVKVLRDNPKTKTSFFNWVPFVHYGI